MDELDRMYRRLVHNIRNGFPDHLNQGFEVASLHQHLIPYRLNRRELALESAEEYELTLTRLLSGARGLLLGDPEMQDALRAELESPNPDLSAFRAYGTATVSLAPDAVRALDALGPAGQAMREPVAGDTARGAAVHRVEMAGRATEEVTASGATGVTAHTPESEPRASVRNSFPDHHGGCRYCGGDLPEARDVRFCPRCGQNLSVKQCPACSTELEIGWQYCITCGRQVE